MANCSTKFLRQILLFLSLVSGKNKLPQIWQRLLDGFGAESYAGLEFSV